MSAGTFESTIANLIPECVRKAEGLKLDFALAINQMLEKRDITYADFARSVGVSPAYVSKVLRGDTNLTIETMVKLAMGVDGEVHLKITNAGKMYCWDKRYAGRRPPATNTMSHSPWNLNSTQNVASRNGSAQPFSQGVA